MTKLILSLFLLLLCTVSSFAAKVDTLNVKSASMNKEVRVLVIAPDGAADDIAQYPVLYLLHGHGGNAYTWLNVNPKLPEIAEATGMIIVCPDGKNSWYWDSPQQPSLRYETFISSELIDYIDTNYPTIADRKGRAITGLSMGGQGALFNAIRHKERFGAAGSTSGGVDICAFPTNWNMPELLGSYEDNTAKWQEYAIVNQMDSLENGELALIIDCGFDDFFFEVNNVLHSRLLQKKIDHDYIIRPGGHNQRYWNNSIEYQLLFFDKFFKKK